MTVTGEMCYRISCPAPDSSPGSAPKMVVPGSHLNPCPSCLFPGMGLIKIPFSLALPGEKALKTLPPRTGLPQG